MPGCCVKNCSHRSEYGFSLKHFPKNPERRAIWASKCGRPNWTPTTNSRICEIRYYYLATVYYELKALVCLV